MIVYRVSCPSFLSLAARA